MIKFIYLAPLYWLMISTAGFIALYQLVFKPHYWEKTVHGLHLRKTLIKIVPEAVVGNEKNPFGFGFPSRFKLLNLNLNFKKKKTLYMGGFMLISATMLGNILNFVFNVYLGRTLRIQDFGELSLFTSLLYLTSIPLGSFSSTISHNIAYLYGKQSKSQAQGYLKYIFSKSIKVGLILTVLWFLLTPFLSQFFHTESMLPILFFAPLWVITVASSNFSGYITGTLSFGKKAIVLLSESVTRLFVAFLMVTFGFRDFVFLSILISISLSVLVSWLLVRSNVSSEVRSGDHKFNLLFFITSNLNGISLITFLTLDVILVKHFLDPISAGQYGLLSLVGKITYFLGSIFIPFIIPVVSHNEGAKVHSNRTFIFLFLPTLLLSVVSFIGLGIFGKLFVPVIFGPKSLAILPLLIPYVLALALFTISQPIFSYFQAKEKYSFAFVGFFVSALQIILTVFFHKDLRQIVLVMLYTSVINLACAVFLYFNNDKGDILMSNFRDFTELLFGKQRSVPSRATFSKKILIFNWRDTKHKWAGGAEVYIQELAKRWVKEGNSVTIFCGNDGIHPKNSIHDGVTIYRRGGFYTVYLWAFFYYIFKFRGIFDVVIDSENGIPFFTPLYVRKPIFLLIHHVHQEVFRESLAFPFAVIAGAMESKLMPLMYRGRQVITVSESSKKEILKLGIGSEETIQIIHPGINIQSYKQSKKTDYPSLLYFGRLKPYKNVDVAIKAFAQVVKGYPKAKLTIAGTGESMRYLKDLTQKLHIQNSVEFLGHVTDDERANLLAESWVVVQPSLIEGWGITVIEANASGTPVIASNVNGLCDSIIHNKTGMLVKVKEIKGFVDAMYLMIGNEPFRYALSQEALRWASRFSWTTSSEAFYDFLVYRLGKDLKASPEPTDNIVLGE